MLTAVPDPADDGSSVLEDQRPAPITGPAVVYDMPEDDYHADPVAGGSLSSTGVRNLLDPHCPAYFRWWADHPQPPKLEFDLGNATHRMALGVGPDLAVLPYDNYRTNAAKAERDAMYAAGLVPLLQHQADEVAAMVEALYADPLARRILDNRAGAPEYREVSVFWPDRDLPLMRRARLDYVRPGTATARPLVVDYKTTTEGGAHPRQISRTMERFGLNVQGEFYRDGVASTPELQGGYAGQPWFVMLVQERKPPYLVTVAEPDPDAALWARRQIRTASQTFVDCTATGDWPGYSDTVVSVGLPTWKLYDLDDQLDSGRLDPGQ